MKCYEVKNFEEYVNLLSVINTNKKLWYRGQSVAQHRLIPGVMRHAVATTDWAGRDIKPEKVNFSNGKGEEVHYLNCWKILSEYKNEIDPILDVKPQNELSWLCFSQHYGIPTPLLDWSTDPLVALFFAVSGVDLEMYEKMQHDSECNEVIEYIDYSGDNSDRLEFRQNCAAVYVIDPLYINEAVPFQNKKSRVLDIYEDYDDIRHLMDSHVQLPFCINGEKNDRRICRQSGNFTVHSHQTMPIDYIEYFRKEMIKVIIPYNYIEGFISKLKIFDLTKESIYFGEDERDIKAKELSAKFIENFKSEFFDVFE